AAQSKESAEMPLQGSARVTDRRSPPIVLMRSAWQTPVASPQERNSDRIESQCRKPKLVMRVTGDSREEKRALYQAFVRMNCAEFTELGSNYYSVDRNYKLVSSRTGESSVRVGDRVVVPVVTQNVSVQIAPSNCRSERLYVFHDGRHLI